MINQSLWVWGLILMVGFPLLTIILGEINNYLHQRQNPLEAFINSAQRLVLPPLVIIIILEKLLKLNNLGVVLPILQTILWLAVAHAILSLVKVILVTEDKQYAWQSVIPNIFFQATRGAVVLGIGAYVLAETWQVDLSQVAAALGVGSIVVALALQDTLSNLVSGFLLLLENPLKTGDWLKVQNIEGKVIELNWRAVRLQTIEGNVVIIPNGALGQETILNYSLPNQARGIWLDVRFSYEDPPNKVKNVLKQVLREINGVDLDKGYKIVSTGSYDDFSITYKVMFMVTNYMETFRATNDFRTRLYYVAKRNGLTIPYPISYSYNYDNIIEENCGNNSQEISAYLQSLPYFEGIEDKTMDKLVLNAQIEYYGIGEQIIKQGEFAPGLYIIEQGSATLSLKDFQGKQQIVAQVAKGDFFGEYVFMSGELSSVCDSAKEDLQVILLESEAIADLVAERPLFAKQIDELIDERRKTISRLGGREKSGAEKLVNQSNGYGNPILQQFGH